MNAVVATIWIKRMKRSPMESVMEALLIAGRGIAGNADQGRRRQITLIDEAAWHAVARDLGLDLDPSNRRANVMLRGLDLEGSGGRLLRLGDCLIRIFGETKPCRKMERAQPGLAQAMRPGWRGGVFAEIITGGTLRVGDEVQWVRQGQASLFS